MLRLLRWCADVRRLPSLQLVAHVVRTLRLACQVRLRSRPGVRLSTLANEDSMTTDPLLALRAYIAAVVRDEMRTAAIKPANDEYLSTADAAEIARVTPSTIRRWVRERQLARHGTGGRVRIKRVELERYLAGAETASPEDRARRRFG